MNIKEDLLRVGSSPVDAEGNKIEPEQQPVQRIMVTDGAEASMQSGEVKGKVPMEVIVETTAQEMAMAMRNPCFSCKHFDEEAWKKLYSTWNDPTAPMDQRIQLNNIRAALLDTQNADLASMSQTPDGDLDTEHALSFLGVCHPLTETMGEAVIVHAKGGCPPEACTATEPNGYYVAKDVASEKMGSSTFDNVMRMAQGRGIDK